MSTEFAKAEPVGSRAPHVPPVRIEAHVLSNEADGSGFKLRLAADAWPGALPGQFAMVGAGPTPVVARRDPLLPRPMAIYREWPAEPKNAPPEMGRASFELLYRVVGRGTRLLAEARAGDRVRVVGPLGRGFAIPERKGVALLVGGGTGIASLYGLARALARAGHETTVLLGARRAEDLNGRDDFAELVSRSEIELVCTTEDGSAGEKGLVTQPLAERLADSKASTTVYAVGPTPMMRVCAELAERFSAGCVVSLENPMACGFGVCLGCAAPRAGGGYALVCRSGPVFDAREIDWAGLP